MLFFMIEDALVNFKWSILEGFSRRVSHNRGSIAWAEDGFPHSLFIPHTYALSIHYVVGASSSSRTFLFSDNKRLGPRLAPDEFSHSMLHGSAANCRLIFLVCQTCPGVHASHPRTQLALFPRRLPISLAIRAAVSVSLPGRLKPIDLRSGPTEFLVPVVNSSGTGQIFLISC